MQVTVETRSAQKVSADALALPLFELDPARWRVPQRLAPLDRDLDGLVSRVIAAGDFRGKRGETLWLYPSAEAATPRVLLIGLGPEADLDAAALRCAGSTAVEETTQRRARKLALVVPTHRRQRPPAAASALALGAVLAGYRFDAYRTLENGGPGPAPSVALVLEGSAERRAVRAAVAAAQIVAESQNVARDLSNEPGNAMTPVAFARAAARVARETGLVCRTMEVPELKRRKMGGILAVGQGSANPPRLIVLEHRPAGRGRSRSRQSVPLCLVGKGITFDSGGISIKPSANMQDMKHDMSGGAAVVGAMRAAALLKLPVPVVGIVAAAENLPSGTAYRPGDVVTTMSGRTIEVLNTDAEGRVVLADALHYARTTYEPEAMVDLATLTGACVIALGKWASGAMGNNEQLLERVRAAGETAGERVWPLPLWEEHRKQVRSQVADIKNTGGREAGATTAGAFLSFFTEGTPWVHVDIAGTAWGEKPEPGQPRGATGVGVRLLVELMRNWSGKRGAR